MHVGVPGRVIGAPRIRLQRLDDRFTVQNLRVKLRLEIGIQVAQLGINVVELVACLLSLLVGGGETSRFFFYVTNFTYILSQLKICLRTTTACFKKNLGIYFNLA